MRYLGVDYGDKRIGLATSDDEGKIAFPKVTVPNDQEAVNKIKKIVFEEEIGKIIVGLPLGLQGSETSQTKKARVFADKLHRVVAVPLEFENELLTTRLAGKMSAKKNTDASAAALILQSYLDKKSEAGN